jgi:predicted PurR-regulated permease PerM
MNMAPTPPPGDRALTARRTLIVLLVVTVFGLALLFLYNVRQVMVWLLVATLLAAALDPAVSWLVRHRWRRGLAALAVSLLALLVLAGVLSALATPLVNQAKELIANFPSYVHDLFSHSGALHRLDARFNIVERLHSVSPSTIWHLVSGGGVSLLHAIGKGVSLIVSTITTLTLMVMLLIEGPLVWRGFVNLFPAGQRAWVDHVGVRLRHSVGGYVRGNLLISLIAAAGAYVALRLLGVPYPLPLAITVGLLDIIPLVGATLGAIVCVLVAFAVGWLPAVILIGYFVVYQMAENHFVQPIVYSRTVNLSPLTVLVASLVGAALAGIFGVLVAIPLASAVAILVHEFTEHRAAGGLPEMAPQEEPTGEVKTRRGFNRWRARDRHDESCRGEVVVETQADTTSEDPPAPKTSDNGS